MKNTTSQNTAQTKEKITPPRATLDFYQYEKEGITYYEFNATKCSPPEPMVNAMIGLSLLKNENERLIGEFFHLPTPLLQKVEGKYLYTTTELENEDVIVEFKKG